MYRIIQPDMYGGICHATVCYNRDNNKLMGSLYNPRQPISNILKVNLNNYYGMSMAMLNGNFKWLNQDECRDMKLLLNYADEVSPFLTVEYSIIKKPKTTTKI